MTTVATARPAEQPLLANELATFAAEFRFEGCLEADALTERVRWHVLDTVGLALSSWTAEDRYAHELTAALSDEIGHGKCTIIGRSDQAPAGVASMLNGSLCHGSDFDDVDLRTVMHCEAFATSALLAVAEREGLGGREFIEAWLIAVEVALRMASAANGSGGLFSAGFHNTAIFGTFGVAAGVSRLLGLDATQTANALALAASFASGTSVGWLHGSGRNKPLQAGWAAKTGTFVADLARAGYTCSLRTIDGSRGMFDAHASKDGWSREPILDGLGKSWRLFGLSIKLYPCGAMVQGSAECASELKERHGIEASEVKSGVIRVPEQFWPVIEDMGESLYRPPSGFTMIGAYPCVVARILLDGSYGLEHMSDDAARDPVMLALADQFKMERDDSPRSIALPLDERPATVTVETNRGSFSHSVGVVAGHPLRLNRERVIEKYRCNSALLIDASSADAIEATVLSLDTLTTMQDLTALLRFDL